tara:strand:- start:458 stop:829 length:372 start_codon:yes stop_codon:yes gene_type:complete
MTSSPGGYCQKKGQHCDCLNNENKDTENFRNRSRSSKSIESKSSGFNFLENIHLFGGAVSQNICKEGDNSWYCGLSRVYSAVFMIIALIVVLFIVLYLFRTFVLPLLGIGKKFNKKKYNSHKR